MTFKLNFNQLVTKGLDIFIDATQDAQETQRQRQERLSTAQNQVNQENEKLKSKPNTSAILAKNREKILK